MTASRHNKYLLYSIIFDNTSLPTQKVDRKIRKTSQRLLELQKLQKISNFNKILRKSKGKLEGLPEIEVIL